MLILERIVTTGRELMSAGELADYLRLSDDMLYEGWAYAHAAAAEIERYCNIALMPQTIIAFPERTLHLPVGPVASGASITVDLLEGDGTHTPVTGWYLQTGTFPKLHLAKQAGGRLRVTYQAGFDEVPADLRIAICDLASRLYDFRADEKAATFPAAAARICARYRRVRL